MSDSNTAIIEQILTTVDALLREHLDAAGIKAQHLMIAFADDGAGVIRSNIGPDSLRQVANMLIEIADQAAQAEAAEDDDGTRH